MKLIRNIIVIEIIFLFIVPSLACGISFTNFHTIDGFVPNEPIVLITGFEPFDIYEVNPSQLIVEDLDGQYIEGAEIVGIILPVDFEESVEVVTQAIRDYNPIVVISIGLSARTDKIYIEKCGLNLKRLPRNDSIWVIPRRIDPCGPFIRLSPLNTREIVKEIRGANVTVRQSFYAGMYVCNAVFYGVLGYIDENEISAKAGFIHVPLLSSQDPDGMELEIMVEAVKLAIETSLK